MRLKTLIQERGLVSGLYKSSAVGPQHIIIKWRVHSRKHVRTSTRLIFTQDFSNAIRLQSRVSGPIKKTSMADGDSEPTDLSYAYCDIIQRSYLVRVRLSIGSS